MAISVNYQQVRVKKMLREVKEYDGFNLNKALPMPGDIGILIDVLHAQGLPDLYVVERTDSDGVTLWLSEFLEEELEIVKEV